MRPCIVGTSCTLCFEHCCCNLGSAVQLMGTPATEKADIWSFGVVLHEICTQEIPVRGGMRPIR